MRRGILGLVVIVVGSAVLAPIPAAATFQVVVDVPAAPVYSPSGGDAIITFVFDPADTPTVFTIRLREPGRGALHHRDVYVEPGTQSSPRPVSFGWPTRSVSAPTELVVDVRRQDGGPPIASQRFTLLPRLISDVTAAPSSFYPVILDGFRDTTTIGFRLTAPTATTTAHVFRADAHGRCCGTPVRTEALGPLAKGSRTWRWDGTRTDGSTVSSGRFFVRIHATDADSTAALSPAERVEVATGKIRRTSSRSKDGRAFATATDERKTAIGGDCLVKRDGTQARVLCANAEISLVWRWALDRGERIETASFDVDGGSYGCHRVTAHGAETSTLRVHAPPTSTCTIRTARIVFSFPVRV
jgi:hypothetical protein